MDNGSTDGTVAWILERYPNVQVIANPQNLGFAAAVNQGVRATDSRYVVTLNNDAEPDPGWLAALVAAAESDPMVGMCASKMLFADRPGMINSTGICLDRAGIAWDRRGGEPDDDCEVEPVEVFGPCGGAALYRRAMLDRIGLFDEDFFAYLEDVDLAWRAQRAGWRCLYVPAARVLHRHSASGVEGSPFKSYQLGRNKVWMLAQNTPFPAGLAYLPLVFFYDLGTLPYRRISQGDWSAVRGRWDALRRLRHSTRKRRSVAGWPGQMSPLVGLGRVHHRVRHLSQRADECGSRL